MLIGDKLSEIISQHCDISVVVSHSVLLSFTIAGQQADYNQSVKHETKCILYMKPVTL